MMNWMRIIKSIKLMSDDVGDDDDDDDVDDDLDGRVNALED